MHIHACILALTVTLVGGVSLRKTNSWTHDWNLGINVVDGSFRIPIESTTREWNVKLKFSNPTLGLKIWKALIKCKDEEGYWYVLENHPYKESFNGYLEMNFHAFYDGANPIQPASEAVFVSGDVCSQTGGSRTTTGGGETSSTTTTSTRTTNTVTFSSTVARNIGTCTLKTERVSKWRLWGSSDHRQESRITIVFPENTINWKVELRFSKPTKDFTIWAANYASYSDGTKYILTNNGGTSYSPGDNLAVNFQFTYGNEESPTLDAELLKPCTDGNGVTHSKYETTTVANGGSTTTGRNNGGTTTGSSGRSTTTVPNNSGPSDGAPINLQCTDTVAAEGPYDYSEVLAKSILFYEAQRSGTLPANNRLSWRKSSATGDKGRDNESLEGGWYDAGDYVKFGLPMASSVTVLTWGLINWKDAYVASCQLELMYESIKWPLDYFIKAHVSQNKFYVQVGNGDTDHAYWGRPEDMTMTRPAYYVDANKPGSEPAAETAAAMAAGSIAFATKDSVYSAKLLNHAKELYEFANTYRGSYATSVPEAAKFYNSYSGYMDELAWAAAWLYYATDDNRYKAEADQILNNLGSLTEFSWDNKGIGAAALLYQITKGSSYKAKLESFLNHWKPNGGVKYTPKGLAWHLKWGSLRYASNAAFIALVAAHSGLDVTANKDWARTQIHYALGDAGRSYVVGFGNNPPERPHHASSSCPLKPASCDWNTFRSPGPNAHVLYGALVGGPDENDGYTDDRTDFIMNEVACDYNAGFQSAVAGLKHFQMKEA